MPALVLDFVGEVVEVVVQLSGARCGAKKLFEYSFHFFAFQVP